MIVYLADGTPLLRVEVDDTSYAYRAIMTADEVRLEFALAEHVEIPVGSYITFEGVRYDLLRESNVRIVHNRDYEYVVTFQGPMERAKNYVIHNTVDKRLNFPLTARPHEHLQLIVDNLNERDGGMWMVGDCISRSEMTLGYNHTYCLDALSQLASACGTEWEITRPAADRFIVNLRKVEYNKGTPLSLGYGRNNGFVPGVERVSSSGAIQKVWIQGGERNISLKEYGSSTLHLPQNVTIGYDGVSGKFQGEAGYGGGITVITDNEGYSVRLSSADVNATEGSLDLSDIYPKREGSVIGLCFEYKGWYYTSLSDLQTAYPELTDDDWDSVQVDFYDTTVPASLDYDECLLVNGEPLTVIFQDGSLAGREFDATFIKEAQTQTRIVEGVEETVTRPANRFELSKTGIDGVNMPTRNFLPSTGAEHKYVVYNCYMPEQYIRDDASFSGAEWDAMRDACAFLYDNKDTKRTYKGSVDGLYAKRNWSVLALRLTPGNYIAFSHPQVQAEPISARIIGIRQYINNPESPEVEISNETVNAGVSSRIQSLQNEDASLVGSIKSATRYAKRGWKDVMETAQMLINSTLAGFTGAISPIVVRTMQAIVGDESLQFEFVRSMTNMEVVDCPLHFDPATKKLTSPYTSYIRHYTLGRDKNIAPVDTDYSNYLRWAMAPFDSGTIAIPTQSYYVYAKVAKTDNPSSTSYQTGEFILSTDAIEMNEDPDFWHLLLGILNSETDGDRSFVTMYGFTEILPGRITTEKIVSSSGNSFWDMVNEAFRLGDKLSYDPANGLVLSNTLVQTGGGAVRLGAYCGDYQSDRYYAYGDQVSWTNAGATMTYTYINQTRDRGHDPSNTSYWQVAAQGKDGTNGNTPYVQNGYWYINGVSTGVKAEGEDGRGISGNPVVSYVWWSNGSSTPPSTADWQSSPPSSHTATDIYLWTRNTYTFTDGSTFSSYSVARDGQKGDPGTSANMPYRENYANGVTYYGNTERTDWVYHTGTTRYYIAKTSLPNGATSFSNIEPGVTQGWENYWSTFGANFDSIAAGFVLAVNGVFENATIRNLATAGVGSNRIMASGDTLSMYHGNDQRLVVSGNDLSSIGNPQGGNVFTGGILFQETLSGGQMNAGYSTYADTPIITFPASGSGAITDAANTLYLPQIDVCYANFPVGSNMSAGDANGYVQIAYVIDGVVVSSASPYGISNGMSELVATLPAYSASLSPNTQHTVAIRVSVQVISNGLPSGALGSVTVGIRNNSQQWSLAYTLQKTEIGANGFRVMFTTSDLFQAVKVGNSIEFKIRSGNYALKVDSSGVKVSTNAEASWSDVAVQ